MSTRLAVFPTEARLPAESTRLDVGAAAFACACVFVGIFGRINQTEEFHVTS